MKSLLLAMVLGEESRSVKLYRAIPNHALKTTTKTAKKNINAMAMAILDLAFSRSAMIADVMCVLLSHWSIKTNAMRIRESGATFSKAWLKSVPVRIFDG